MSLLIEIKRLIRKHRTFPKKSLAQNFTIDSSLFKRLAEYASLNGDDVVLDAGAGLGFLTRFLGEKCKRVIAVELDPRLVNVLQKTLKDLPNVEVVEGDVLKTPVPQFDKLVSVPPYNISSAFISWLFDKKFACAVLVLQKEFTNRLVAPIGSEDYGWLTVLTYYHFETEILEEVPTCMFYPMPKVESAIVRLKPKNPPPFTLKNQAIFKQFVRSLFSQRNRKIKSALEPFLAQHCETVKSNVKLTDSLPYHDRRVRELAPEDFGEISNVLFG